MKVNYITAQEYVKRNLVTKQKKTSYPKDIVNLINHAKNTSLGNDPKNLAEILVMMNSVGLDRILDYFK